MCHWNRIIEPHQEKISGFGVRLNPAYSDQQADNPAYSDQQADNPAYSDPQAGNLAFSDPPVHLASELCDQVRLNPAYSDPEADNPVYSDPQADNPAYSDPQADNPAYSDPQAHCAFVVCIWYTQGLVMIWLILLQYVSFPWLITHLKNSLFDYSSFYSLLKQYNP